MKAKQIIVYILLFFVLLLGITFATINANPVAFDYYFNTTDIPLSLLLVYTLGIGIILGFLSALTTVMRLKNTNRKLKHQLEKKQTLEASVENKPIH